MTSILRGGSDDGFERTCRPVITQRNEYGGEKSIKIRQRKSKHPELNASLNVKHYQKSSRIEGILHILVLIVFCYLLINIQ